jgi:hypothetical protein
VALQTRLAVAQDAQIQCEDLTFFVREKAAGGHFHAHHATGMERLVLLYRIGQVHGAHGGPRTFG